MSDKRKAKSERSAKGKRKALADRSTNVQEVVTSEQVVQPKRSRRIKQLPKKKDAEKEAGVPVAAAKKEKGKVTAKQMSENDANTRHETFVQVKRTKAKYRAMRDEETGSIQFIPKGRKKPIDFDSRKHELIKEEHETPDGKDSTNESEQGGQQKDDGLKKERGGKKNKKKEEIPTPNDGSVDGNNGNDEASIEKSKPAEKRSKRKKNTRKNANKPNEVQKSCPQKNSRSRKAQPQSCLEQNSSDEESKHADEEDCNADNVYESSVKNLSPGESAFFLSDYGATLEAANNNDWRTASVIDY